MSGDSQSYDNTTVGFSMSGNMAPPRLVNKCMSTHLKANVSLESNAKANAIFQERIQIQIVWGRIQMQMFWLHNFKCI